MTAPIGLAHPAMAERLAPFDDGGVTIVPSPDVAENTVVIVRDGVVLDTYVWDNGWHIVTPPLRLPEE